MSRKIDALVAEHVMGLRLLEPGALSYYYDFPNRSGCVERPVPRYSTYIVAAREVIEKLNYLSFNLNR